MPLIKRRLLAIAVAVVASLLVLVPEPASADEKTVLGYWKHIDEDSG